MTGRHMGYVVLLAQDVREDDAERIVAALHMVKGVAAVTPVVADVTAAMLAEQRLRLELHDRMLSAIRQVFHE